VLVPDVTQDFFYLLLKPLVVYLSYVLRLNFECLIFNVHYDMKHSTFKIKYSKLRISWYTNFGILSTLSILCV